MKAGAAAARGVGTEVVVGARTRSEKLFRESARGVLRFPASAELERYESHAKLLLIDGKTLLWGTGNLTKNGLEESSEMFLLTRDPKLIEAARSYLDRLGALRRD